MTAAKLKRWMPLAVMVAAVGLLFWLVPLWIIGTFFLVMGGLLLLFLVVPVILFVEYKESVLKVKIGVLFIPITILPVKQRPDKENEAKKKKKTKKKEPKKPKETKEKKPMEPEEVIHLVKRILSSFSAAMRLVLRGFWIRGVKVVFPIGGQEAGDIAATWGKLQQVVVSLQAFLENFLNIQYDYVVLVPDYAEQYKGKQIFACKIIVSPLIMFIAAAAGGIHFLRYKKRGYTLQEYIEAQRAKKANAAPKPKKPQGGQQRSE